MDFQKNDILGLLNLGVKDRVQDLRQSIDPSGSGVSSMLEKDSGGRLKFWEVETCFTCPIVGMCLTVSEQKRILKKTDFPTKKASLYEIHEALVVCGDSNNKVSRRIDALLERKFMKTAAPLFALDDNAFMDHFKTAFESGDYLETLWAAAVNPKLPLESKRKVFGEIHMTMHFGGEERRKMKQKVHRLDAAIEKMTQEMRVGRDHRRELQKRNDETARELLRLKHENESLKIENRKMKEALQDQRERSEIAELERKKRELEDSLSLVTDAYADARAQLHGLNEKREQLSVELKLQKKMTDQVREEAGKVIGHVIALSQCTGNDGCECDESCPAFDLCRKRILIVGGISRMESIYREFIENSGGTFDYHDGYVKKGVKPLEERLKRADMVLCPVNCNSHAACAVVKRLGKKHKKNVHMLHNYSLSTVSQVIRDATVYGEESAAGTFGF